MEWKVNLSAQVKCQISRVSQAIILGQGQKLIEWSYCELLKLLSKFIELPTANGTFYQAHQGCHPHPLKFQLHLKLQLHIFAICQLAWLGQYLLACC